MRGHSVKRGRLPNPQTACELRTSVSKLLRDRLRSRGAAAEESAAAVAAADAPNWVQDLAESVRSNEEVYSDDLAGTNFGSQSRGEDSENDDVD